MKIKLPANSIFIKLFLIIVLTGVLITALFAIAFRLHFSTNIRDQFNKNINNYFVYLSKEIGSPPDTSIARRIAREYSLEIAYQSKTFYWSSGDSTINNNGFARFFTRLTGTPGFTVYNADGSRFLFSTDLHQTIKPRPEKFLFLILMLLFMLSLSYLAIRRVLAPVKLLKKGVDELSKGNFSHKIQVTSRDELADLSGSFNEMTNKIREMIIAREQLLLDVSHELRSPITRIKLALEMIPDNKNKESISQDVKEMETMITEILETERLKEGYGKINPVNVNITELIKEVAGYYIDKKPGINTDAIPDEVEVMVDVERMKTVFKNIIDNALKYSHTQSRPVIINVVEELNKVRLSFKDDGIGIPAEDLPFVFEPFYRTDKSRTKKTGGYGLGLSICKKIVEAHNGRIEVSNNTDRGITITIELNKNLM